MTPPPPSSEAAADTVDPAGARPDPALSRRAHQLLDYLTGLHRLRHPTDLDTIPANATLTPNLPADPTVRLRPADEVLLEIDRVRPPTPVEVPAPLRDRVDWTNAEQRPRLTPLPPPADRDRRAGPGSGDHDEPEPPPDPLEEVFASWAGEVWEPWYDEKKPTFDARRLFLRLYDQRLEAERDLATHEAVWARGVAVGRTADGQIARLPLFVQPVRYELDDRTGTLRVLSSGPPRLEIDAFERLVDTFDLVKRIETELTAEPTALDDDDEETFDALAVEADVLERLSKVIADATHQPMADAIPAVADHWQIVDIECLFHRRRPVKYEAYFKALEEEVDRGYLPDTWASILADEPTTARISPWIGTTGSPWNELGGRMLSPLPLNEQQRSVVTRLSSSAGVTVQGPPGTGKSYTIAALTSHLLANGLRVLICAEKPQPLRVIRNKMPEELRDLCVAVLGDDRASTQQLEASIAAITARVNGVDPVRDQTKLDEIDGRLDVIRRQAADLRRRELELRMAEQATLALPGHPRIGVAEAARELAAPGDAAADGLLVDDIAPEVDLPLTDEELTELLRLTTELPEGDRARHGTPLCAADRLYAGTDLTAYWAAEATASTSVAAVTADVDLAAVEAMGRERLEALIGRLHRQRELVAWAAGPPWAPLHAAVASSEPQRRRWQEVMAQLDADAEAAVGLSLRLAAVEVTYPDDVDGQDPGPLLADLRQRFAEGRGLPRLGGGALKALVAASAVDGRTPATAADIELIEAARARADHRRRLTVRWQQELAPLGLPPLEGDRPEDLYQTSHQQALATLLGLPDQAISLADDVAPLLPRPGDLAAVCGTAEGLTALHEQLAAAGGVFHQRDLRWMDDVGAYLDDLARHGHPVTVALARAWAARDTVAWDAAATDTHRLLGRAAELDRHAELNRRLAVAAPSLAGELRQLTPSLTAAQVKSAWRRRQLRHWVDGIVDMGDQAELSGRIADAEEQEARLLNQVVSQQAWLRIAQRTTGAERSALETWAQAMARVGKGTGKHAPRHRLTAQRAMRSAQSAVPVWIMSISQAIDSFRPGHDAAFDVIVIDEASQAPLDAMAVLGLGQRVLVVGDDKQISPTVIIDETEADRLRRQHLLDVPDAEGFDVRTSLYDTAARRFPGVIQLREHFRCLPEIIGFSNDLAYDGRIDPLRERHPDPRWEPVRAVAVADAERNGMVNAVEAEAVIEVVQDVLADERFGPSDAYPDGATIGVVAMVGQDQGRAIQSLLLESVPTDEIERRNIRVGSPYQFQGDERDVMIISMVDAPDPEGGTTGQAATNKRQHQSYNVAASRARDHLIVLHSFDPAALADTDLRRRLVHFARHPAASVDTAVDLHDRCESRFERDVLDRLLPLGLQLRVQYPVAGYHIDVTATDADGRRVAIECDGDNFVGSEQLRADAERQRILERVGWRFARLRASAFYADPDGAVDALVARLAEHGLRLPELDGTG